MANKKVVIDLNHILYPSIYWLLITFVLLLIYLQIYKKFVPNKMLYTILIISVLLLVSVLIKLFYVMSIASKNSVFFSSPRLNIKKKKLPDKHFQQSESDVRYFYQMNIYLPDYKKFLGKPKNIFMKGINNTQCSPGLWFTPTKNNILFRVALENNNYSDIILENVPLRKWFTIGFFINNQNAEVYLNGELVISRTVTGMPLLNNNSVGYITNEYHGSATNYKC